MTESAWYGDKGLLLWFKTWLDIYNDRLVNAYKLINLELIPSRRYDRALVWCLYVFDVTILTHQMVSLVREDDESSRIQSVYYLDTNVLIDILKRLENQMNQCRATFDELLTLNAMERLYVSSDDVKGKEDQTPSADGMENRNLPTGVTLYGPDPEQAELMSKILESGEIQDHQLIEMAASLEILRASSDRDAVHRVNFDQRLPPNNVRAVKLITAPGDAAMARLISESYLSKLHETVDGGVRIYRIDYSELLSKWRGESEKNFENIMRWMVDRAHENATDGRNFDVLWVDSVHALMSQRGGGGDSGGEDYLNVIKTTMLQSMDVFNKDTRLSRFALLFSTGKRPTDIDAAFRRRIDNVYEIKRLDECPAFREVLVKHLLYVTKINVEGAALVRLNNTSNVSELQRLVYAYYVHCRFIIGTEFYAVAAVSANYNLQPLKSYFNLNGHVVRTGRSVDRIVQAVERGNVDDGGPRYFYRPGEIDGRNLSDENADVTVYVLRTDPTGGE